ncbi:MAG: hypothetical protein H8E35_06415 [Ardenticatenia bacterium]|nr:hypothetical protein [Ardenticatenia bacterium]
MYTEALRNLDSLEDWEAWLAPQIRQVELLGEIPITADECAQLGKDIGLHVRTWGHSRSLRTLRREYPCALAVYMVAQGVYGYQGGDYWSEVIQVTGLNSSYKWQVGQTFERILEDLDLPLFYDMRAEAHRYVSRILAHGGIPNYCLPDFFKNMLQPAVTRSWLAGMNALELIEEWQWYGAARYFTDKPVLRFLTHGGQVAEDFLERCLEMARCYHETGVVSPPEELGLPSRVVNAYRQWVTDQAEPVRGLAPRDRPRLRKPQVLLDPWGEGVFLELPIQRLPKDARGADITWQVTAGPDSISVPTLLTSAVDCLETRPRQVLLDRPAQIYEVTLRMDGKGMRTWRFQGPMPGRPLLAFDPILGVLVQWHEALPARCLWLLIPDDDRQLQVGGAGYLLETMPRLPGDWSGYNVQHWDLSDATELTITRDRGEALIIPVRPDEAAQRPRLEGKQLPSLSKVDEALPLYVGQPPAVHVPVMRDRPLDEQLHRWRLSLRTDGPAIPQVQRLDTLAELQPYLRHGENYVELPLALPSLLGNFSFGTFTVRVRGPLGRDAYLPFRTIPHLELTGHDTLYLPDSTAGPPPASLMVSTAPEVTVHCEVGENGCQVQSDQQPTDPQRIHHVQVDPDTTIAKLILTMELPSRDTVKLPLRVPIHRLRWGVLSQGNLGVIAWTGRLIRWQREAIMQAEAPQLIVELPTSGQNVNLQLTLALFDADGTELQRADPQGDRGGRHVWRFDLRAFLDTVRASRVPTLRFALTLTGLPLEPKGSLFPLLDLVTGLVVEQIKVQSCLADDRWLLELTWHEEVPLRRRQVSFWPLWRPWQSTVEHHILDEANDYCSIIMPCADLTPGKYRVEFTTVDPWAPPVVPRRPPQGALNTAEVELGTRPERLRYLFDLPCDTFGYLEHALAEDDLEDQQRQQALHHLSETFEEHDVSPILDALLALGTANVDDHDTEGETVVLSKVEALAAAWGAKPEVATQSTRDILGRLLLEHLCPLLREVALRVGNLDQVGRAELRRLLLALGLFDSRLAHSISAAALDEASLETLWQFWPPLGLILDSFGVVRGAPHAYHRARLHLGTQWLSRSTHYDESPDAGAHVVSLENTELFGSAPEAETVEAPAKQLEKIARFLRLVPQGLLDPDSWTEANLAWLITVRTDSAREKKALRWVSNNLRHVIEDLMRLDDDRLLSQPLADRLRERYVQDPVCALRNIPFLIGAVALIQRMLAHSSGASRVLHGQEGRWRHLSLQALDIASHLYTRDLCLFELVLAGEYLQADKR